jgi:hypothetical protein
MKSEPIGWVIEIVETVGEHRGEWRRYTTDVKPEENAYCRIISEIYA